MLAVLPSLEITFPTDRPIAFVSVQPIPGWTWTAEKTTLATPIKTEDGDISRAVSKITWTGGAIAPALGCRLDPARDLAVG